MKIGVKIPPVNVSWETLEDLWSAAGRSPHFDSVWSFDHLLAPDVETNPCFECWTAVAWLAHLVPDKLIGHIVLSYNFRAPGMLAKMSTVMDHATRGRFVVGLGAAWFERENRAFGLPFSPSLPERLGELESSLAVLKALFAPAGMAPDATVSHGPYVLERPVNLPAPLTSGGPPIWLGTQGRKIGLRLVARYADGWNYGGGDVDTFASRRETLRTYCEDIGRDPTRITLSAQHWVGADPGDLQDAIDHGRRYRDAGCDLLILHADLSPGRAALERLEDLVARPLRDA